MKHPSDNSVNGSARASRVPLPALVIKLALRELRGGLVGFGIFLGCLALGVGAIASVGSISRALSDGLSAAGTRILGGDISFSLLHREASNVERDVLERFGKVSSIAILRAMVLANEGAALVEVKAVDDRYPSVGAVETDPVMGLKDVFRTIDGVYGAAADIAVFERLGLKPGDTVRIGQTTIILRTRLLSEPDKLGAGVGFGPRLLMSQEALRATGLLQPGSLVRWTYRLGLGAVPIEQATESIAKALPEVGWEVRTRDKADPRFAREVERFSQFLTLVGLTALLVGGVGVANAVNAYVDRKRTSFAIMKSVGAPGGLAVVVYFTTVLAIALVGIALGSVVGMALPFAISGLFGEIIPVPLAPTIAWGELALAMCYGFLIAIVFAVAPLGRMHDTAVSSLFREEVTPERRTLRKRYRFILIACTLALAAISIITAYDRKVALIFIAVTVVAFGVLRGVAFLAMSVARRLPRSRNAILRLAMTNIYRPGALTSSLVLSLGLGISLLVTLNVVDANLRHELTRVLPQQAPNFFFLDIPSAQTADFDRLLEKVAPGVKLDRVPMMRGRIVFLKGQPTSTINPPPNLSWVLEGDRGVTYSGKVPEGSRLVAGEWWPEDYGGKPLVSFEDKIASALGLTIGDEVTVNVLGRNVTATIANLRAVDWRSLGINFVMVFSPNTFAGAPHTHLATAILSPEQSNAADEAKILRQIAEVFPSVTTIRIKDQLEAFSSLVGQLLFAVRGISAIALAASLMVLAGALAANQRARLYDAVILKTLGATRGRLLTVYLLEYGFLGLVTAIFGTVIGIAAAYAIISQTMLLPFSPLIGGAILTAIACVVFAVVLGLAGTWRILKQKPASVLKEL